jgi:23S rRNA pseudouridine1911/1915/1917 synthase
MTKPFWINSPAQPYLAADTASYLIAYKPPRMHTAPLHKDEDNTLLAWTATLYPEVLRIKGRKENEGGLVHRLDYETHGLVLIAKTQHALEALLEQQENNAIIKEYDAVSCMAAVTEKKLPGFPIYTEGSPSEENRIVSAFRPFGKGGKTVRPLIIDFSKSAKKILKQTLYTTEILFHTAIDDKKIFRLRITKGFRHQIRCHLAWIGYPILNDALYGGGNDGGFLALRASSLTFADPENGEMKTYSV